MKKTTLVCILILLCVLLCACEDAKPVETTADVETTAVTTVPVEIETNGFLHYQISMLPWLRDFCNAQNGRGDMFGIIFKRPKDTKTYLHYSAYETTMKALDTTDCFAYLRMAFPEATFSDSDAQSAQTTDGTAYLYFKAPDADAYNYYFVMIPYPNQLLCGAVTTQDENVQETFVKLVDSIQVSLEEDSWLNEDIRAQQIPNLDATLTTVTCTVALQENEYTVSFDLPDGWEWFFRDFSDAVYYGEFGKPTHYPHTVYEHCIYQAFRFDGLTEGSLTTDDAIAQQYPIQESGQTSGGAPYIVYAIEIPEYHAIEYRVCMQIEENIVASFMLCVDSENTDLLQSVISSMSLEKHAETTTAASVETTASVVTTTAPAETTAAITTAEETAIAIPTEQTIAIERIKSLFTDFAPDSLPVAEESENPLGVTVAVPKDITAKEWNAIRLGKTLDEIDSDSRLTVERVRYEYAFYTGDISEIGSGTTASGKEYIFTKHQYRDEPIYYSAYLRIAPNYIWCITTDMDVLDERTEKLLTEILESAVLTGAVDSIPAVQTAENFVPVVLDIEYYKNLSTIGNLAADDGALTGKIELLLPASWVETKIQVGSDAYMGATPPETAFVADFDALSASPLPGYIASEGLYCIDKPETFRLDTALLNRLTFGRDFYPEETVTEGMTEQGYPYLLRREDIGNYATAHYMALVQVSDLYVYCFDLYCDLTNETIIYTILNSLRYT